MRRIVALLLMCASCAALPGRFELCVGGGYGFPAARDALLGDAIPANTQYVPLLGSQTQYDEVYASLGNGLKIDVEGTWLFGGRIGLALIGGFQTLGGFKAVSDQTSTTTVKLSSTSLSMGGGIRVRTFLEYYGLYPELLLAPVVVFPWVKGEVLDGSSVDNQHTSEKIDYSFTPALGFTLGAGFSARLNDRIGVRAECVPTYAFARLTQQTTNDVATGASSKVVYVSGSGTLPPNTADTEYRHSRPVFSFSAVAPRVQILVRF